MRNIGEKLLDKANEVLVPQARIVAAHSSGDPAADAMALARLKVAIDFGRKRGSFQLQAMVEGWDIERIKREMY